MANVIEAQRVPYLVSNGETDDFADLQRAQANVGASSRAPLHGVDPFLKGGHVYEDLTGSQRGVPHYLTRPASVEPGGMGQQQYIHPRDLVTG